MESAVIELGKRKRASGAITGDFAAVKRLVSKGEKWKIEGKSDAGKQESRSEYPGVRMYSKGTPPCRVE